MRNGGKRKEELVAEYLAGEMSYREMEERYGVSSSTLQRWVKAAGVGMAMRPGGDKPGGDDLGSEVKRLREELRKAELHAKLLNAMIDIAEDRFEIPIRKKHGARR
ncbi:MAG: transposase [Acidobacteria bacterium]|nr:transposase [Acidobacteriota bacterium]